VKTVSKAESFVLETAGAFKVYFPLKHVFDLILGCWSTSNMNF